MSHVEPTYIRPEGIQPLVTGRPIPVHPPEAMMHFPLFQISLYFRKFFQTPWKIFPILPFPKKLRVFTYFLCFSFPQPKFDHDAFMHHTMHVLDAPVWSYEARSLVVECGSSSCID